MRRPLVTLTLMFALLAPAVAHAGGSAVIRDCTDDGRLEGHYTQADLRDALNSIPSDVDEYTNCRDIIRRAAFSAGAGGGGKNGGGRPGAAGSGGGSGGGGAAGGCPVTTASSTPARRAAARATSSPFSGWSRPTKTAWKSALRRG